jgi:hypothetical protein
MKGVTNHKSFGPTESSIADQGGSENGASMSLLTDQAFRMKHETNIRDIKSEPFLRVQTVCLETPTRIFQHKKNSSNLLHTIMLYGVASSFQTLVQFCTQIFKNEDKPELKLPTTLHPCPHKK